MLVKSIVSFCRTPPPRRALISSQLSSPRGAAVTSSNVISDSGSEVSTVPNRAIARSLHPPPQLEMQCPHSTIEYCPCLSRHVLFYSLTSARSLVHFILLVSVILCCSLSLIYFSPCLSFVPSYISFVFVPPFLIPRFLRFLPLFLFV